MLNDEGKENGKTNMQTRKKQYVSLATTKKTTTNLHVQYTFFFYIFLSLSCTTTA